MRKYILTLALFVPLLAAAQNRVIHFSRVDEVKFAGNGTLHIAQSDHNELKIESVENAQVEPVVTLKDHQLEIKQKDDSLAFKCTLLVKDLNKVTLEGNAKVETDPIKTKNLQVVIRDKGEATLDIEVEKLVSYIHKAGKVFVQGKSGSQYVALTGDGLYQGSELSSKECSLDIHGAGVAYVNAENKLSVAVDEMSQVHYQGDPAILQKTQVEKTP